MIRVQLPAHLQTLARVPCEVAVDVTGQATLRSVLDALEASYPVLRGTIREHTTLKRRPYLRFFACEEDLITRSARHAPCLTPSRAASSRSSSSAPWHGG